MAAARMKLFAADFIGAIPRVVHMWFAEQPNSLTMMRLLEIGIMVMFKSHLGVILSQVQAWFGRQSSGINQDETFGIRFWNLSQWQQGPRLRTILDLVLGEKRDVAWLV